MNTEHEDRRRQGLSEYFFIAMVVIPQLSLMAPFCQRFAKFDKTTNAMQQGFLSISLLVVSNVFMTLAWYGHLYFKKISWLNGLGLIGVILVSWGLAFFEYIFQVPANRFGHELNGGPFNLVELKVIQEVISLSVFTLFAVLVFKSDKFQWNYLVGFVFLILAVFFIFKKW